MKTWDWNGEVKSTLSWSADSRCKVSYGLLVKRLHEGMTIAEAMTTPPKDRGRNSKGMGIPKPPPTPRILYTAWGTDKSLAAWSRDARCKVNLSTIRFRLSHGIPLEVALSNKRLLGLPREPK